MSSPGTQHSPSPGKIGPGACGTAGPAHLVLDGATSLSTTAARAGPHALSTALAGRAVIGESAPALRRRTPTRLLPSSWTNGSVVGFYALRQARRRHLTSPA